MFLRQHVEPKTGADNKHQVRPAVNWLLDQSSMNTLPRHGNTRWTANDLTLQASLWVWAESKTLAGAFDEARAYNLTGRTALTTYQGLAGALETWTGTLMKTLLPETNKLMRQVSGARFRIGRFVPIAVDGSRTTTPRTVSNEKAFFAKNYGQGKPRSLARKRPKD